MQQFSTTGWANGVTSPKLTDFQAIVADLAKRGVTIDGGGYGRANTSYLLLTPGDLPGNSYSVTAASWVGGVATLTVGAAHNIQVGQHFSVSSVVSSGPQSYNLTDAVAVAGTTGTTIKYSLTTGNPGTWTSGGTVLIDGVAAANGMLKVDANGNLRSLLAGAWSNSFLAPSLLNSWTNYGSGIQTAGYMIDALGFVHLRGSIAPGTTSDGTNLFQLPLGFRPASRLIFQCNAASGSNNGSSARVDVYANGNAQIFGYPSGGIIVSLDGIVFPTF
jgi:hypothetical protein